MLYEKDAARDEPSFTDIKARELFGDDMVSIKDEVDNRTITPIFNQGTLTETSMWCWSYGLRHLINVCNYHTGGWILDPKFLWKDFVDSHKTNLYDPVEQGSSLQDQLVYANKKKTYIDWYYKLPKNDVELFKYEAKQAISKWHLLYSGAKTIDRQKTRDSKDKIAIFEKGSAHIFSIDGYNKDYLYCRNSYGDKAYDKWYFKIQRENAPSLFSVYAVIDSLTVERKEKIKEIVTNKKKHSIYTTRMVNWRPLLKWRPL